MPTEEQPAAPPGAPGDGAVPPQKPPVQQSKRLQQTQAQVDEVVDIMKVNVDKVLERDQKLSELDERADSLQAGASQFEASAGKLKRKMWWKNMKMTLMMVGVGAVVIGVLVFYFVNKNQEDKAAAAAAQAPPPGYMPAGYMPPVTAPGVTPKVPEKPQQRRRKRLAAFLNRLSNQQHDSQWKNGFNEKLSNGERIKRRVIW